MYAEITKPLKDTTWYVDYMLCHSKGNIRFCEQIFPVFLCVPLSLSLILPFGWDSEFEFPVYDLCKLLLKFWAD